MIRRDFISDFYDFLDSVEKEMRDFSKSFVRRENVKQDLPDEIDLYNFFEKFGGVATCVIIVRVPKYIVGLGSFTSECKQHIDVYSMSDLEDIKDDCERIEYYIGEYEYHAIKFKDRGTFLVSEKRYQKLKEKKGE